MAGTISGGGGAGAILTQFGAIGKQSVFDHAPVRQMIVEQPPGAGGGPPPGGPGAPGGPPPPHGHGPNPNPPLDFSNTPGGNAVRPGVEVRIYGGRVRYLEQGRLIREADALMQRNPSTPYANNWRTTQGPPPGPPRDWGPGKEVIKQAALLGLLIEKPPATAEEVLPRLGVSLLLGGPAGGVAYTGRYILTAFQAQARGLAGAPPDLDLLAYLAQRAGVVGKSEDELIAFAMSGGLDAALRAAVGTAGGPLATQTIEEILAAARAAALLNASTTMTSQPHDGI